MIIYGYLPHIRFIHLINADFPVTSEAAEATISRPNNFANTYKNINTKLKIIIPTRAVVNANLNLPIFCILANIELNAVKPPCCQSQK